MYFPPDLFQRLSLLLVTTPQQSTQITEQPGYTRRNRRNKLIRRNATSVIKPKNYEGNKYHFMVELSLYYGRRSVDQFVLVSGSPLGPMTKFYPFLSLVTIVLMFFLLGALSDERNGL
jgi:hypothetical protein